MKKIILLIIIANIVQQSLAQKQGQEKIDSILTLLKNDHSACSVPCILDSTRINHLNDLSGELNFRNSDTAQILAFEALNLSRKIKWKKGIIQSLFQIGVAYHYKGDLQSALKFYSNSREIIEDIEKNDPVIFNNNFRKRKLTLLSNIAIIYSMQGEYMKALEEHFKILKISEESGDQSRVANEYTNIAITYKEQGEYLKALDLSFQALKIHESLKDKRGISADFNNIGNIYLLLKKFLKAREFFFRSLKIDEELNFESGIAKEYANIGLTYKSMNEFSKALEFNFKSLKISEDLGNDEQISVVLGNIAVVYDEQKEYSKALDFYFKSLKIREKIGAKELIATSLGNIGALYTDLKNYNDAEKYLKKSLLIAEEINSLDDIQIGHTNLSELYSKTGQDRIALVHYQKAMVAKDSLFNEEKSEEITRKAMNYEFDKKEAATKAEQDKKDALTKAELQKQKVLKYAFIVGAILLLSLALVLYNRYRFKQKSNKIITKAYDDLKKAEGQLVHSEKMASLGQLTAGIAHEINNPINFVSANVNPLKRNYYELVEFILKKKAINEEDLNYNIVESNELFSGIEEGATRTTEIVKGLRNFSRLDEGDFKDADINEGIDSTLMLLHNKLNERNIEVVRFPCEIPEIKCFPGQLNQVFMNVLSNAIDAIGENGKITISTSLENAHVKISITDTGKGMSQEVRQKIFEPFFTTKDVGKGTGLGLSISYGIIQEHKGKIEVQSQTGKGAEFIITLPVS